MRGGGQIHPFLLSSLNSPFLFPPLPFPCRFRGIDPQLPREQLAQLQQQTLAEARSVLDELAAAIGAGHMLSQGAMRYYAQINVMMKRGA